MDSSPCAKRGEADPRSATRKSHRSPYKLITVRDMPISFSLTRSERALRPSFADLSLPLASFDLRVSYEAGLPAQDDQPTTLFNPKMFLPKLSPRAHNAAACLSF